MFVEILSRYYKESDEELENEYSGYNDACKLDKIKGFLDDTVINKFCQILYYRFLIKRYN